MELIQKTVAELSVSGVGFPERPLLEPGHRYDFLTIDNQVPATRIVYRFDDRNQGIIFQARSGDTIAVKGRLLYAAFVPDLVGNESGSGSSVGQLDLVISFWAWGACEQGVSSSGFKDGQRLMRFDVADISLAAAASQNIIEAADFSQMAGLPVFIRCSLQGGALDTTGTAQDFPLELILSSVDNSGVAHERVWLFPAGAGGAFLAFNVPLNRLRDDGSGTTLSVLNPTGSVGTKTGSVMGEVVVGHVGESVDYPIERDQTPVTPGTNYFGSQCFPRKGVSPTAAGGELAGIIRNHASVGSLTLQTYSYVPSIHGGPVYVDDVSQAIAAATTAGLVINLRGHYAVFRWRHTATPTGPRVFFSLLNP